jgi:OOP family OmpA-OmpF porin
MMRIARCRARYLRGSAMPAARPALHLSLSGRPARRAALMAALVGTSLSVFSAAALAQSTPGTPRPAAGASPVPATPMPKADDKERVKTASLPARGLFVGDQLSESAKARLTDLVIESIGMDVQVALIVPTGPWVIDGGGHGDRDLTEKRLGAVRQFLQQRGVDPRRTFVESRIDQKIKEPRLDIQLLGRPSSN